MKAVLQQFDRAGLEPWQVPSVGEGQGKGESESWELTGKSAPIENSRFGCGSESEISPPDTEESTPCAAVPIRITTT